MLSKLFAIILDSFIENIVVLDIELKIAFGLGASHQIDYISCHGKELVNFDIYAKNSG